MQLHEKSETQPILALTGTETDEGPKPTKGFVPVTVFDLALILSCLPLNRRKN